ncbi:MAG: aspartyl-tRNA(Asn)/glutamyl-tRNA(Gln) amidotransferase subunit A [Paracoccaceae bacterium]|jgi:aspartyl-tRNA(Asn)/glutamyl-tRNA(Gln) amidotransferase subunit A
MTNDAWSLDATDLIAGYRGGALAPDRVAALMLARIARIDPDLGAYSALNPEAEAEAEASAARWRAGAPIGPLDGVPVIIKDNLVARGMPAAWGNAELARRIAQHDELPVARLRAAGAVVLGKGNTPEFAVEGYTDNLTFGPTRNPFDPALTPGGSSGGVVAAVAAGLATLGIGTDGGGSIRRPAGYVGLTGLKPGIGHVPRSGGLAQVLLDFEVVGPLARSARDVALMDAVLRGPDRRDPPSRLRAEPVAGAPLRVLHVARIGDAPCDGAILAATEALAARLAALGCEVTTGAMPFDLGPLNAIWGQIAEIGLARYFALDPAVAAAAAPKYRDMAGRGGAIDAPAMWAMLDAVRDLRAAASAAFARWDVILTPSSAAMPWPARDAFPPMIDGVAVGPRGHAVYTGWVNAAGHPAISVPAAPRGAALPIGVQLVGDLGAEDVLLTLAARLEREGFVWPALARRTD